MTTTCRFVLTGGPGVGKTALLEHLAARGYTVVRETARDLIEEQKALNSTVLPWRDATAFQKRVLEIQLDKESMASGQVVFLDRGVPDGMAYLLLYGLAVLPELVEHGRGRYTGVFLLEPLAGYQKDTVRREDARTARRIQELLEKAYRDLGYEPVRVPPLSVEERAQLVLAAISHPAGMRNGGQNGSTST
ncbi:MAG: ATP-binding protein [Planctomycetes bacterium]|nr:ATP-binding protein [Planctomycetota bacterium]